MTLPPTSHDICRLEISSTDLSPICQVCDPPIGWHWENTPSGFSLVCDDHSKSLTPANPIHTKICGQYQDVVVQVCMKAYDCDGFEYCSTCSNYVPASNICYTMNETPEAEAFRSEVDLSSPFPNPVNQTVRFSYRQKQAGTVRVVIYDEKGNTISTAVHDGNGGDTYVLEFGTSALANGRYTATVESHGKQFSESFIVEH